jgi:hypothetical protein
MPNYHVTKNKDKGIWQYKKEGADRVAGFADTQKDAEKFAKEIVANQGGGEVKIHKPSGPIRDSDTVRPGNDPCPPKDKKY